MSKNIKLIHTEIPIVVSSNPAIGAFNLSTTPNPSSIMNIYSARPHSAG